VHALQVVLGVSTLVLYVPVSLGAAHQAGALALLTGAVNMLHTLRAAARAPIVDAVASAGTGMPGAVRLAAMPLVGLCSAAAWSRSATSESLDSP
jgi:hypothetical protein